MAEETSGPRESALDLMVSDIPAMPAHMSAGAAVAALWQGQFSDLENIYVVSHGRHLEGVVPLRRLFASPPGTELTAIMIGPPITVHPFLDQEKAAAIACDADLSSLPVTGPDGTLLGAIPGAKLLQVLRREHVEDLHRLAGIIHKLDYAGSALETSPRRRIRDRLPWLVLGLSGAMIAAMVVAQFEAALQASVAVAFFVPAIVYLADAIGTQTEAVAVRGLSLSHSPLARLLLNEIGTGALLGLILGAMAVPLIIAGFGDARLAVAVGVSIFAAGSIAAAVGLLFPWLLSRTGFDPAYGSGPIATVIQDILSLLAYFIIIDSLA